MSAGLSTFQTEVRVQIFFFWGQQIISCSWGYIEHSSQKALKRKSKSLPQHPSSPEPARALRTGVSGQKMGFIVFIVFESGWTQGWTLPALLQFLMLRISFTLLNSCWELVPSIIARGKFFVCVSICSIDLTLFIHTRLVPVHRA